MKIYVLLIDLRTFNTWKKYFDTEFERDKYIRRSFYFRNVKVVEVGYE